MYYTELKRWGVMKNYKAKEKDMLVEQVCEALANGQDVNRMQYKGQNVKHHCVLRHWRAKARKANSPAAFNGLQPSSLVSRVDRPSRELGGTSPGELILLSTKTFIADLLEVRLGTSHPLTHICRNVRQDNEGPRTAESTLELMSHLLEENLGPCHHETFLTATALIARHLQNGDVVAAEITAQRLVRNSELSPNRATQLPKALRQLAHVLTTIGRYNEAITIQERILSCPGTVVPRDLRIYTMEDIAELHRLQGDYSMESKSLREALVAAREFFGPNQTPTLHIWDKFVASMSKQGMDFEGV
ncbi:hypothetical protein CDV31_001278 [Fusarium ambrosium]|uniref:Clr5 domain-containing protein n=1 Tax=Fusarium ambrosium TaxID=131363 RepID=A0A428V039_9HYPO|nr:hypothetical protein CDV31_001278 [Fusarium ambrosium]